MFSQAVSMNLNLITGPGKEWFTAQKSGAFAIRRGMDSGHAKDFIYTESFTNQGKNKGVRATEGTWGVHNNTVDSILLEQSRSGGERQ